MAEEIKLAETSAPPPLPDLPKPSLLPPTIPVVSPPPPPPVTSAPPVRMGALTAEETPEVGGALAPFNTRMSASIIDIVISAGLCLAVSMVLPGFMGRMATLIGMAYLVTRDSLPFLGGQSVGKKAMHLRAVTLEGKPLTGNWEAGLIRSGVLLIPFFGLVELFVLLTREGKLEQGRRLGDEWAKTKVIIVPAVEG